MSNNIEAIIYGIAAPLVGGRFYWDTTPQSGPPKAADESYLPFAIGQIIGGTDEEYVDQQLPDYENHRLQIVAFAPSSLQASDTIRAIRKAILDSYKPAGIVGSVMATYDPRLLLRGRLQHFSLWIKP